MRLTNMSFTIMYLGWLNYLMISCLPVAITCTILLYPIFMNAYLITIFLFITMYIILSTLVIFAVGTFFRYCKLYYHLKDNLSIIKNQIS